ncbi:unnamed protein product [Linum tenue]|uniref:Uncharacterized protein n=2 Tax=Linum tenue TaxID=586396 RepID=A0AAV0RPZ8_9ROSI|nr:unnamed protein product [Linum tenue]
MRDESSSDSLIPGRHVSRGMRLLVNLYKIQRDQTVWSPDIPTSFGRRDFSQRGSTRMLMLSVRASR